MENENQKITYFTDLNAWKESHKLILMIYKINFPREELFGLANQLRRAAVSITSNIAEGFSRQSYKEKVQFYSMAQGSMTEVQNQLMIARDVRYVSHQEFQDLFDQSVVAHKLINGLIKSSKSRI